MSKSCKIKKLFKPSELSDIVTFYSFQEMAIVMQEALKYFSEVGCGYGVSSLAALKTGARVISFDLATEKNTWAYGRPNEDKA